MLSNRIPDAFEIWKKFHQDTLAAFIKNEHEPLKAERDALKKDRDHWREARRTAIEAGDMLMAENAALRALLKAWSHFDDDGIDAALREKGK